MLSLCFVGYRALYVSHAKFFLNIFGRIRPLRCFAPYPVEFGRRTGCPDGDLVANTRS